MGRGIYGLLRGKLGGGRSRAEAGGLGESAASRQGCSRLTPALLCGLRPFQGAGRGTHVPIVHLGSLLGKLQQLSSSSCLFSSSFWVWFWVVFFFVKSYISLEESLLAAAFLCLVPTPTAF